ncbi:MAG: VWA domain-containing protein [Polyangiaceae bacterium]|nr:VWA domain-containing protein [Polyangiaceae bacterium]
MSFLSIAALLVALFVAAPIAAHLLRRRKAEEQPFPPAELVPPTKPAARRRSMLEDRGLFAVRALSVLLLAALGATPFVNCARLGIARKGGASAALTLVIDDSLSMRAPLDQRAISVSRPSKFTRALEAARELADGLNSGDAVAIVLAGAPPRVALAATTNLSAVKATLDSITPSDRATDLEGAIRLGRELVRGVPHADRRVVLFSDLADGSPDAPPIGEGSDIPVWIPLPELEAKGSDCAITRADRSGVKVRARIVCSPASNAKGPAGQTSASAGRSIQVFDRDKQLASAPLGASIRAEEVVLEVPANAPSDLIVKLSPGDTIAEDDVAPVVHVGGSLPIGVVVDAATSQVATGGPPPIEQALSALQLDAEVRPLAAVPDNGDELGAFAGIVIDDVPGLTPEGRKALAAWVEHGGVLLATFGKRAAAAPLGSGFDPVVPGVVRWAPSPATGAEPSSAFFLGPSAEGLNKLAPEGRASFEPIATAGADILARWTDGAPLLWRRSMGRGAVFALSLPLSTDESDFVLRPAFLALLERFVGTARSRGGARLVDVGDAFTFDGYKDVVVEYVPAQSGEPSQKMDVAEQNGRRLVVTSLAGRYVARMDGEQTTRIAAVPEREIDLRPRKITDASRAETQGGVQPALDASPYVALGLLGLFAIELILRTWGQRRDAASVS